MTNHNRAKRNMNATSREKRQNNAQHTNCAIELNINFKSKRHKQGDDDDDE